MLMEDYPKVSIIWLNYNSYHILKIVSKSIESLIKLDYPNYEIIIVDNGSNDGSFEEIKKIVQKFKNLYKKFPTIKMVRLRTNLGFTGGITLSILIDLMELVFYVKLSLF